MLLKRICACGTWKKGGIRLQTGILGGTFDPVHRGHIQIAKAVRDALRLERIMLLPSGDPPHKSHPTDKSDRFAMAQLACEDEEGLYAADDEIRREGTTYTVDTLRRFHVQQPDTEWFYVIGEDTLEVLDSWRSFAEVAKMCTFVVVGRGDTPVNKERIDKLSCRYGAKFISLNISGPEISSTDIRTRIAQGLSVSELVPPKVDAYIRDNGLYLCGMPKSAVVEKLQRTLKPSRYKHTLGVAETAKRLAPKYGIDPAHAELAGLLHDCAKYMDYGEMVNICAEQPDVDALEMETEGILHAPAGSILAEKVYGVRDPSILSAIRKHTIGDAEMSALDALIYTADFIEPGREPFAGLNDARRLAEKNIYAAMLKCASLTQEYLQTLGMDAHPKTKTMMLNYADKSMEVE